MKTNLLGQIILYLKNPFYIEKRDKQLFFWNLFQILRINLLALLLSILSGVLIAIISTQTQALDNHAVGEFIQEESLLATFIFACVVAPLLEETAFRLWLVNKPFQLAVGIVFFLFYYISSFVPGSIIQPILSNIVMDNPLVTIGMYFFIFITSIILIYGLIKQPNIQNWLKYLFENKFQWIFYSSALLFGFLHITNYQFSWTVVLLTPILVLPQLSGGVLLSFIRVKYGFWRCVIGHAFYNFSLLIPSLGIKLLSTELQTRINDNTYELSQINGQDLYIFSFIGIYVLILILAVLGSNLHLLITYLINKKPLTKTKIGEI